MLVAINLSTVNHCTTSQRPRAELHVTAVLLRWSSPVGPPGYILNYRSPILFNPATLPAMNSIQVHPRWPCKPRSFALLFCAAAILLSLFQTMNAAQPTRFLRFQKDATVAYGLLEGDQVRQLSGDLFGNWSKTDTLFPLASVKILTPTKPTQVLALAGNYRSHLGDQKNAPQLKAPEPFLKSPSCLIPAGETVVLPKDSEVVHAEAEMVIVIGKTCRKVAKDKALDCVLGVTAGNDVSERIWQNDKDRKDTQWWRAKGTDTFGPVGPFILSGVDYGKLNLTMRINGKVVQQENTDHLIHDVPAIVSFISQYITLHPGDLIFTGTPGKTSALKPGDIAEVELEGVGILKSPVVAGN